MASVLLEIPDELKDEIKLRAETMTLSVNAWIRLAILHQIKKHSVDFKKGGGDG